MKVSILGVEIDNVTMEQVLEYCNNLTIGVHYIFTPNPEIIMEARDEKFKNILNSADLLLPDGIGIVIASKILGTPIAARVAGFDFVCNLLKTEKSFYLLGGKPGVAERAAAELEKQGVNIAGTCDGYFTDDSLVISDINAKKPDVLLVCLGAPKQERWIYKNRDKLSDMLCIGAGGVLDVFAGDVRRAPDIYIKLNIEWLYRAVKQPQRFLRLWKLPWFLVKVVWEKI